MRYHFSLFVIFSVGLPVLAAPVNSKVPPVKKEDIKQGNIYWSRLRYVKPEEPGLKYAHKYFKHPVVVLSDVDAQDQVKVAQTSKHPTHGPVEPASNYADLEGSIGVGPPKTVHINHLNPPTNGVYAVRPGRLQPLIDSINANCPTDQRLVDCKPSGSAQHNTEHGRPEHDNSKQGGQQGSSNKGSSSESSQKNEPGGSKQGSQPGSSKQGSQPGSSKQGSQADSSKHGSRPGSPDDGSSQSSRPGSTMQSSQKNEPGGSTQGSQPGSSKQGRQADSSKHDDGWQVVTSRQKNKASKSRNK